MYFDVVPTAEEEVVPWKLKNVCQHTESVASKEVQQVKERYHPSFSFVVYDISVPNHGVHLEHKILLWKWLLKYPAKFCLFVGLFFAFFLSSIRH